LGGLSWINNLLSAAFRTFLIILCRSGMLSKKRCKLIC
jgi:hypothetical protein